MINIVSCLKHANLKSTKSKIANEVAVKINECLAYIKKKWKNDKQSGQTPITYEDLRLMFERTPSSLKNKARIFSLYLFALYTGSRAITCVNVQLRDIKLLL